MANTTISQFQQNQFGDANDKIVVWSPISNTDVIIPIGNLYMNVFSSVISLNVGGTVLNSSSFAGTSNNATNLGGTLASAYVNTSGNFTLAGNITFGANLIVGGKISANGGVGTTGQALLSGDGTSNAYWGTVSAITAPIGSTTQIAYNKAGTESGDANLVWLTANGTLVVANGIIVGLAGTNTSINTTSYSGTSNNALYLGGTLASSFANTTNTSATNITTGTLPWAQAPTGTVNTSGNFTLAGNITHSANLILNSSLAANGGIGTAGQILTSNGTTGSPYWSTFTSGAIGSTTQIAYNKAGVESGDANLLWYTANGTLSVANGILLGANVYANTSSIYIGNSSINSVINSSSIAVTNGSIQSAFSVLNTQTGTTYTTVNTDSGRMILSSNAGAVTITVSNTMPANSRFLVTQLGVGKVTVANQAGQSLYSRTGAFSILSQYGSASVFVVNSSFILIDGNI